jgi:ADP-heptose:LPS heptosyltransferase
VKYAAARGVDALLRLNARRDQNVPRIPDRPRVLVVRCDHIGDAVMATSVLKPLRDALNPSTLDVLAGPWAAPIFEHHPAVDSVLTFATPWWREARGASFGERMRTWAELPGMIRSIKARRYDVGIDLRGDLRQILFFLRLGGMPIRASSDRTGGRSLLTHVWTHDPLLHEVEKNAAIAALLGAVGPWTLDVAISKEDLASTAATGFVAFALRGSEENREWPAAQAAAAAEALYAEFRVPAVIVGTTADAAFAESIVSLATSPIANLAGRTSLMQTAALLRCATMVVAVDSGPMHLAAAVGAPVVALFGPGDPRECRPWSDRAEVVAVSAPCGCPGASCEFVKGAGRCMREIAPGMVVEAVRRVLRGR